MVKKEINDVIYATEPQDNTLVDSRFSQKFLYKTFKGHPQYKYIWQKAN